MKKIAGMITLLAAIGLLAAPAVASESIDAAALFNKKCKMCHALDKKKSGPAITAMSQDEAQLKDVIANGGKNKMMKAYSSSLSEDEINALVAHIRAHQ